MELGIAISTITVVIYKIRHCRDPRCPDYGSFAGLVNSRPVQAGPGSQPAELTMQLIYAKHGPIGGKYAADSPLSAMVGRHRSMGKA